MPDGKLTSLEISGFVLNLEAGITPPDHILHSVAAALRRIDEGEDPRKVFKRGTRGRPRLTIRDAMPKIACVSRVLELQAELSYEEALATACEEFDYKEGTVHEWCKRRSDIRQIVENEKQLTENIKRRFRGE